MNSNMSKYVNTNYFLLSVTIVECILSKFSALVPMHCEGMSPILIEAILFLKQKVCMRVWICHQ